MTKTKITLQVAVYPDVNILSKLASDYVLRATTHPEHEALFNQTGLSIDKITSYFVSALWRKARGVRFETEGRKIPDKHLLQKLHFPMGFCRHIISIGNVESAEYRINVTEEQIITDVYDGKERLHPLESWLMTDDEMREVSQGLFALDSFMPTAYKQYKFDNNGDEAMFGIIDPKFAEVASEDERFISTFSGKAIDEKYLEITAVLGLKAVGLNSPILYPNLTSVNVDAIRQQFRTGEGFHLSE